MSAPVVVIDGARWGQRQHRREVVHQALRAVRRGALRLDLRIEWTVALAPDEQLARQRVTHEQLAAELTRRGAGPTPMTANRIGA